MSAFEIVLGLVLGIGGWLSGRFVAQYLRARWAKLELPVKVETKPSYVPVVTSGPSGPVTYWEPISGDRTGWGPFIAEHVISEGKKHGSYVVPRDSYIIWDDNPWALLNLPFEVTAQDRALAISELELPFLMGGHQ